MTTGFQRDEQRCPVSSTTSSDNGVDFCVSVSKPLMKSFRNEPVFVVNNHSSNSRIGFDPADPAWRDLQSPLHDLMFISERSIGTHMADQWLTQSCPGTHNLPEVSLFAGSESGVHKPPSAPVEAV